MRTFSWTDNKVLAQELHDKLKAEAWRITKLGDRPERSWDDAVVRWLKEQSRKASIETDKIHLRWLDAHLGGRPLASINRALGRVVS